MSKYSNYLSKIPVDAKKREEECLVFVYHVIPPGRFSLQNCHWRMLEMPFQSRSTDEARMVNENAL